MATKLYLTNTASDLSTGGECLTVGLGTKGAALSTGTTDTTAGGSNIQLTRDTTSDIAITWYTPPLNSVSIVAASVAINLWMSENNMSANVSAGCRVTYCDSAGTSIADIISISPGKLVELPVTTRAAQNWTPGGTNATVAQGNRIRIQIWGVNIGTMGGGFTFNAGWAGTTDAADGDTYVQFAESITAAPAVRVPRSPGVDSGNAHFAKAWQAVTRWKHSAHGIFVPETSFVH